MNLSDIRFPRQLEADDTAETIRCALLAHTVKLRPDSNFVVPLIEISEPLKIALRKARLNPRWGISRRGRAIWHGTSFAI